MVLWLTYLKKKTKHSIELCTKNLYNWHGWTFCRFTKFHFKQEICPSHQKTTVLPKKPSKNLKTFALIKPNYFKKQRSSSSFLHTWSRYTSQKWSWSLTRLVPCLKWMELGCQVLLGHFGSVYLLQVSKNDDEERCF